jgi:diacylglycerol kinase
MNSDPDKFSVKKRLTSFKYAFSGLKSLLLFEHNSRIHLIAAILAAILGIVLKISATEWSLVVLVIGFVFAAELFNSAIEKLADVVSPEHNEMIKRIKDYCAASVLVSSIAALLIGVIIFVPKILRLI